MGSSDFEGRTIFEVLDPETAAEYEPYYRRALAGESFLLEHRRHGRDYVTRGVPLRNGSPDVESVLAVSYDMTDRIWHEKKLRLSEGNSFFIGKICIVNLRETNEDS